MAIRSIRRQASNPLAAAATPTTAPIYVDSDDNKLKFIPAGSGTTEVEIIDASSAQTLTNKSVGTINDSASVNRLVINPTAKTIVDGSATSLFDVACATNELIGGTIHFLVKVGDGTDLQALAGIATYSGVNKAGTHTLTITNATGNDAKAVSSGTLTLAFTIVTGASKATVKVQPTGSLTETTPYSITYTVVPLSGAVTIV